MLLVHGYHLSSTIFKPVKEVKPVSNKLGSLNLILPKVEPSDLQSILLALRDTIPQIQSLTYEELINIFERCFTDWLKSDFVYREKSTQALSVMLGYSIPMINYIFDSMFTRLRVDLHELKPMVLRDGIAVCTHPETPGPQIIAIIASLLRGMPIFCKSQPTESTFTTFFMQSLAELDPRLAKALVCIPWEGGTLGTKPLDLTLYAGLGISDLLIFFGSPNALANIRRCASPQLQVYAYTKSIGSIILGREMLSHLLIERTILQCAYAISAYNRSVCVSPQMIFVEKGGEISPEEFCGILSSELERIAANELPVGDLGAMYGRFANANMAYEMLEAQGLVKYFPFSDGDRLVGGVIYIPRGIPELPEGGNVRTVTVCPIKDMYETIDLLHDRFGDLHSIGISDNHQKPDDIKQRYQQMGVRVTQIDNLLNLSFKDYNMFE